MATMNVSIPETLKSFVETQVEAEGYGTSSEYIRELIRKDRQRAHLRNLIMQGIESGTGTPVDDAFWKARRKRQERATVSRPKRNRSSSNRLRSLTPTL